MLNNFLNSINSFIYISCIILIILLTYSIKKIKLITVYSKFLFLIYILIFLSYIIFDKNLYNKIYNWDDYSHWLRVYKIYSIYGLNHLKVSELVLTYNSFPNNIIQHYPAINSYVASILFPYPYFDTFNVYFLQIFFLYIIIFDLYIYLRVPGNKVVLFLLISLLLFSGSTPLNHNLLSDIVIPALIVLGLSQIKNSNLNINFLFSGSLFAYAIMIKPPTAIVLVFIAFTNLILIENKFKYKWFKVMLMFFSILIPYILFLLIYIPYLNTGSTGIPNGNITHIINSVINNFFEFFRVELLGPIFSLKPSKSSVNLISIIFICWCYFVNSDKRNVIYVLSSLSIYLLYLAITYNFVVLDSSNERFASFDRYFLSYYIYIMFYFMHYIFTNEKIKNYTWILIILLYFNTCYFVPNYLLLMIPVIFIAYLLRTVLQNKLFLINYFLPIFFIASTIIMGHKFYPPKYLVENGLFLQQFAIVSKNSADDIVIIEVCNPTQYDYLALSYYSNFSNNFSVIEIKKCSGDFKYRYASGKNYN
ncbi:hypothetical protein [Polynucleobacter duraquae]|uniref:hypothetical protein n=1 Tax=Polynucleobacter duraquae TaxID=1835254 RepID=UPI0014768C17|nr:hypothetical protein [Polynucleobacter duraquae]